MSTGHILVIVVGDLTASELRRQPSVLHVASCAEPGSRGEKHQSHTLQYPNCGA